MLDFDLTPYIIPAIVVIAALSLASMAVYLIYYWVINLLSPLARVSARAVRKRHFSKNLSVDLSPGGRLLGKTAASGDAEAWDYSPDSHEPRSAEITLVQSAECFITFDVGGRELEFRVPTQLYIDTHEGDEGLLVYRGELFRKFIPGAKRNLQ
jgi:hypothetical protein